MVTSFVFSLMAALVACSHGGMTLKYDDQARKQVDSVVYADRSVEALQGVLQKYESEVTSKRC